jgi:hypothetical protein
MLVSGHSPTTSVAIRFAHQRRRHGLQLCEIGLYGLNLGVSIGV